MFTLVRMPAKPSRSLGRVRKQRTRAKKFSETTSMRNIFTLGFWKFTSYENPIYDT
jgi:hypothetical protein